MDLKKMFLSLFGYRAKMGGVQGSPLAIDKAVSSCCSGEFLEDPWIQFMLYGLKPHGVSFEDILKFKRVAFDTHHDFIQWFFPNRTSSPINPLAPVLSDLHVLAYERLPELRTSVDNACAKFMDFLGFRETPQGFYPTDDFERGSQYWVCRLDHNHRRISRLLAFYREIGRKDKAESLLAYLELTLSQADLLGIEALPYWRAIVSGE
jgi:hypothetical protein